MCSKNQLVNTRQAYNHRESSAFKSLRFKACWVGERNEVDDGAEPVPA